MHQWTDKTLHYRKQALSQENLLAAELKEKVIICRYSQIDEIKVVVIVSGMGFKQNKSAKRV